MNRTRCLLHAGASLLLVISIDTALSGANPADDPAQVLQSDRPDYREYLVRSLDRYRTRFFPRLDTGIKGGDNLHPAAMLAAAEVRAWQWTKDERYAHAAAERLRLIAQRIDALHQVNFFTPYPLAFAYRGLAEGQKVNEPFRQAMERFVTKCVVPRDDTNLNNQTMIRACGLELAAQVWPHVKPAHAWHEYALKIYRLLERTEDIPENSPNYNTFDLLCTFLLTDLLDKHELLARPGIRAMYVRYRDQISPRGWIAPYGDAGNPSRPPNPDWPITSPWAQYVPPFERAAREYRDPTLRWAALHLAQAGSRYQPLGTSAHDAEELFYMSFAAEWMDPTLAPQRPRSTSQI